MLPEKIYLINNGEPLVEAWNDVFQDNEVFEAYQDDYFAREADAMVSPANCFGVMDGGLDLAIRDHVGYKAEERLKKVIIDEYHGELPIGNAVIVETDNAKWPYLISAPTMRIPMNVSNTLNAYLAFRAILLAVSKFNQKHDRKVINSIICSGLGTGIGQMPPRKCAGQMRVAYSYLSKPARIPSFDEIHKVHKKLSVII